MTVYVPRWAMVRKQDLVYWASRLDRAGVREKLRLSEHDLTMAEERLGRPTYKQTRPNWAGRLA
jgi:hypothetical protein